MKEHNDKFDVINYLMQQNGWGEPGSFLRKGEVKESQRYFKKDQVEFLSKEFRNYLNGKGLDRYRPTLSRVMS